MSRSNTPAESIDTLLQKFSDGEANYTDTLMRAVRVLGQADIEKFFTRLTNQIHQQTKDTPLERIKEEQLANIRNVLGEMVKPDSRPDKNVADWMSEINSLEKKRKTREGRPS